MNNADLIKILTTQMATAQTSVATIQRAIDSLKPKTLSVTDLKALNEMGMTIPPDAQPTSGSIAPLQSTLDSLTTYTIPNIAASLKAISPTGKPYAVTIRDLMQWGLTGDDRFSDVPRG